MNGVRIAASFLGGRASSLIWTSVLQNGRPYTPRKKNLNIEILCKFESHMNLHFILLIERWNSDSSEGRWLAWTSLHWTSYLLISCKEGNAGNVQWCRNRSCCDSVILQTIASCKVSTGTGSILFGETLWHSWQKYPVRKADDHLSSKGMGVLKCKISLFFRVRF